MPPSRQKLERQDCPTGGCRVNSKWAISIVVQPTESVNQRRRLNSARAQLKRPLVSMVPRTSSSGWCSVGERRVTWPTADHASIEHHKGDVLEHRQITKRVSRNGNDIRELSDLDRPDTVVPLE